MKLNTIKTYCNITKLQYYLKYSNIKESPITRFNTRNILSKKYFNEFNVTLLNSKEFKRLKYFNGDLELIETDIYNTYNWMAKLTNHMQVKIYKFKDTYLATIQIHLYGDIRTNYSDPLIIIGEEFDIKAALFNSFQVSYIFRHGIHWYIDVKSYDEGYDISYCDEDQKSYKTIKYYDDIESKTELISIITNLIFL